MLKRIISAIVLIAAVVTLIYTLPLHLFALLTSLIILYAGYEWAGLMKIQTLPGKFFYLLFLLICLLLAGLFSYHVILGIGLVWWLVLLVVVIDYARCADKAVGHLFKSSLAGVLVLVPCWMGLNSLRMLPQGQTYVLFALILVWGADSGAYFAGKFYGNHLLAKRVSPKKTLEGLAGGIALTVVLGLIELAFLHLNAWTSLRYICLCIATGLATVLGDLYESMIKRSSRVKDSGHLIPGHGGLLDRIDGLTAAIPLFTLGVIWLRIV